MLLGLQKNRVIMIYKLCFRNRDSSGFMFYELNEMKEMMSSDPIFFYDLCVAIAVNQIPTELD